MKKLFIGFDPGVSATSPGAMAAIDENGKFVYAINMPIFTLKDGKKNRNVVDVVSLSNELKVLIASAEKDGVEQIIAAVEDVGVITVVTRNPFTKKPMVTTPGGTNASLHECKGAIKGILAANGIKMLLYKPKYWQKVIFPQKGFKADKELSRKEALERFPEAYIHLKNKSSHGKAEALLQADVARMIENGTASM